MTIMTDNPGTAGTGTSHFRLIRRPLKEAVSQRTQRLYGGAAQHLYRMTAVASSATLHRGPTIDLPLTWITHEALSEQTVDVELVLIVKTLHSRCTRD